VKTLFLIIARQGANEVLIRDSETVWPPLPFQDFVFSSTSNAEQSCRVKRAGKELIHSHPIFFNASPFEAILDFIIQLFIQGTYPIPLFRLSNQHVLIAGDVNNRTYEGGLPRRSALGVAATEIYLLFVSSSDV
jgi:hypothetical protein